MTRTRIFSGKKVNPKTVMTFCYVKQTAGSIVYFGFGCHSNVVVTQEVNIKMPLPCAGIFRKLKVFITIAQGAGKTTTIRLRKNGSDTDITVALTNATSGEDVTHEAVFAAGDLVSFSVNLTAGGTEGRVCGSIEFYPLE